MTHRNLFGGNPNSLYFPMSETEQEALSRILDKGGLKVLIKAMGPLGHIDGIVDRPRITHGDARVQIPLDIEFSSPDIHIPIYNFELALVREDGRVLFKQTQPALYQGQPTMVGTGVRLEMLWDFTVTQINPELVKEVKPGAVGLTSRVGNTYYDSETDQVLHHLREQEAAIRADTQAQVEKAAEQGKKDFNR